MRSRHRTGDERQPPDRAPAWEQMTMKMQRAYPWFVKGDLDGFFGLAVDNLVQVLVIVALCKQLCGFTDDLIYSRVLPGIAVSLFIGNLYYAWHARRVARRDNNRTCTALPYGINTPSVFAYIFFILTPVYARNVGTMGQEAAATLAWQVGLIACIGSGIIEFVGAFVGSWIRRITPRAALLSALAAIAIIFIASPFAFQIFERPLVAIIPMFIVLVGYFAKVRFPLGLPSGFVAVIIGTLLAWTIPFAYGLGPSMMDFGAVGEAAKQVGVHKPQFCGQAILELFRNDQAMLWAFIGVIFPMGLINAIGSLQNIESAEAAGDRFTTGPCMAVNGIGSMAAGLFGSCFPTTIYIGHPGWKALGARSGYSIINALFFSVVFVLGLGQLFVSIIPMEAGIAIVMWIGIIITAQSYEAVPKRHYSAVAIAFFPAVAAMAILLIPQILSGVGAANGILPMFDHHREMLENPAVRTDAWWPIGVYALAGANSGFIITCIIISAVSAFLIDRKFKLAGMWCIAAMVLTLLGFQHAYRVEPDPNPPAVKTLTAQELLVWQRSEVNQDNSLYLEKKAGAFWFRGYHIAAAYGVAALLLFGVHTMRRRGKAFEDIDPEGPAEPQPPPGRSTHGESEHGHNAPQGGTTGSSPPADKPQAGATGSLLPVSQQANKLPTAAGATGSSLPVPHQADMLPTAPEPCQHPEPHQPPAAVPPPGQNVPQSRLTEPPPSEDVPPTPPPESTPGHDAQPSQDSTPQPSQDWTPLPPPEQPAPEAAFPADEDVVESQTSDDAVLPPGDQPDSAN